ncbi:MAG: hypothetical protein Q7T30_00015 [Planctomycetota bacterium]|nr:hypothetical protein [Planctomycetota bacterium]
MFLTRHFVFVHVPRTGGNFVLKLLQEHTPAEWEMQRCADHATVHEIPPSHATLPCLAFVRNPYDWYVSWYHYQQRKRDPFFLEVTDNGTLPFADAMRRALRSREALALGEGPYTQTIRSMLGNDLVGVRFGKVERLRVDLQRMLSEIVEVPASMADAIRSLPRQNTSEHDHWRRYYDAELRELIADKDRSSMTFFGYGWDDAS